MAAISQQLADITVLSIVVRILLSTFCAGTLGFERERHNQAAGFRTYIIVSDASALVMMTNIFVAGIGETDLVRMSASVITGLGFLGAGTILVTRNQEVRGLTTAAGLWAVAIIGTAFGAGFLRGRHHLLCVHLPCDASAAARGPSHPQDAARLHCVFRDGEKRARSARSSAR